MMRGQRPSEGGGGGRAALGPPAVPEPLCPDPFTCSFFFFFLKAITPNPRMLTELATLYRLHTLLPISLLQSIMRRPVICLFKHLGPRVRIPDAHEAQLASPVCRDGGFRCTGSWLDLQEREQRIFVNDLTPHK